MKTIALLLAMFVASLMYGQDEASGRISATVNNVSGTQGEVLFALYTEDNFMKKEPNFSAMSKITDGIATVVFENVPEGTYALVVMHDKNSNKQMDFDPNGMPKEDYGTSGNTMSFGPGWNRNLILKEVKRSWKYVFKSHQRKFIKHSSCFI
ncbi:DUF2141 domain-containing protein [Gramella sp. KN1008]|uniref:DUF2141 domain-containing protein n=1 Tax=Gramella sp. KN1008 TaxID=2529298 RepID=UPI001039A628|nr:DUF2141 domain-containing protein [Gramella sp. KN1008]TBW28930.1 DUF2141 domain-containing protein [Gramella sp. KN1008]